MDQEQIREALIAGGIPAEQLTGKPSDRVDLYSPLLNPALAEDLIGHLAEQLRVYSPTRIAVWEDLENSILAYVVARHLDVPAVRVVDASGVLDYDGTFDPADQVAIVADAFRSERPVTAMRSLAEQQAERVVAIGALLATPTLAASAGSIPTVITWSPGAKADAAE